MLTPFIPPWQMSATKKARDRKSHPHRSYFGFQMKWIQNHALFIPKVCCAIDVKLCEYNPAYTCNDINKSPMGPNMGIPQAPIPKGWHKKMENGKYTPCGADDIVFDAASPMKFLYENPTGNPIGANDIKDWGHYVPYNRFKEMVDSNFIDFYEGSIGVFTEHNMTSTKVGAWPRDLKYSVLTRNHLESFHRTFGPHLADLERQLCHIMDYTTTLKRVQKVQRQEYYKNFTKYIAIIIRNRFDINNEIENDEINEIFIEIGNGYKKEDFIMLLKLYIKTIPKKVIRANDNIARDKALLDESTWICRMCGDIVQEECDETGQIIPHPCCEICYEWFHCQCVGIEKGLLKKKQNIFLCDIHSGNESFITKDKKSFKY